VRYSTKGESRTGWPPVLGSTSAELGKRVAEALPDGQLAAVPFSSDLLSAAKSGGASVRARRGRGRSRQLRFARDADRPVRANRARIQPRTRRFAASSHRRLLLVSQRQYPSTNLGD